MRIHTDSQYRTLLFRACLVILLMGLSCMEGLVGPASADDPSSSLVSRQAHLGGQAASVSESATHSAMGFWGHRTLTGKIIAALIALGVVGILMAISPKKRRCKQKDLERSDFRFRQILENIREVIWVVSSDLRHLDYVSPAYETIWNRTRESLYADPLSWMEAILPNDLEAVKDFIAREGAGESEGTAFPAFRIFQANGEVRWIHARIFGMKQIGAEGNLKAVVAQDVTRSKLFETALRESEEKWRSLTENSPDQVMLTDLDGYILYANRGFMGHHKADLVGKHLVGLIPPRFGQLVQSCLEGVVRQEEPEPCCIECVDAKGRKAFYELRMSPVTVSHQTVAVAVHSTDITNRVEQETILLESEAFHRMLFEESPNGISIQDFSATETPLQQIKDSGVKDVRSYLMAHPDEVDRLAGLVKLAGVNQATVDLFHAPSAQHMLGPLYKVLKKKDRQHFIDQLVAFTSGEDRYEGEARNRDYHGKTLHLMIRKVVINRSENGLGKILASLVDATQIKAAEKERHALMSQLQQSQKMEAIGNLAGGVAHDFNNILSIILGNAELSLKDIEPKNSAFLNIQEIRGASLRAKEIVQQLLGFSRRTQQDMRSLRLMPLVQEALKFLRATIPTNIVIQSELLAADDVIRADATQIHQVMINLLTNASHAMEETGGNLTIQADNVTLRRAISESILPVRAGSYVRIVVTDTGMGISDELKGRIFEPYFTTKNVGKGTGMGLAVVHGIINTYGGGIVLKSRPDVGTTFELYFPLVNDLADEASSKKEAIPTGNERVLFVDDEEMIVEITEQILKRLGYRVQSCTDPAEALSLLKSQACEIDLLITDMTMPGLTGDQLVQRVRLLHPQLPVILCTGHSDSIPEHKFEDLGIAAVLHKPVELNTLAMSVRHVLDRGQEIK